MSRWSFVVLVAIGFLCIPFRVANAKFYVFRDERGILHIVNTPAAQDTRFQALIEVIAHRYDLSPALIKALIKVESNFNPWDTSKKGAMGLTQLMPDTAKSLDVDDVLDPGQNIDGGARYLRQLLDRFGGDLELTLAAYNAGPTRVEEYGGVPPFEETQNFVRKVLWHYRCFDQEEGAIYFFRDEEGNIHLSDYPQGPQYKRVY